MIGTGIQEYYPEKANMSGEWRISIVVRRHSGALSGGSIQEYCPEPEEAIQKYSSEEAFRTIVGESN